MKRRILHLIPCLAEAGAERQLTYLSEGLVDRGWEVHVGYVADGPNRTRLTAVGAKIHPIPSTSNYDPRLLWRVKRLIHRVAPDAVQTWIPMMDLIGGPLARLAGLPWILSERTNSAFEMHHRQFRIRAHVGRLASAVVANSESGCAYWVDRVSPATRCVAIPNALPLAEIEAATPADRSSLGIRDDVPLVVSMSRLDKVKNLETLMDAAERLFAVSDAHLLIGGVGQMREYVERRIDTEAFRGRVHAPGLVPNPWSWMKAADAFISLSRYEGMPNAVIEAMATGCPLVVSDIPQHREILDESSARFVPLEDADIVAEALLEVLEDFASSKARVAAAKRRTECFAMDSIAERWEAVYLDVITGRGSPRSRRGHEASKR